MRRWLYRLGDWFRAHSRERRRERYFRALRRRQVAFGAGFNPPETEHDRQRKLIAQEQPRFP